MNNSSTTKTKNLYSAILSLKTDAECEKFFGDLLTTGEIKEFANRWQVAQMLDKKIAYEKIAKETGMSSTTIARISKWLTDGMGGYKFMLARTHHTRTLVS